MTQPFGRPIRVTYVIGSLGIGGAETQLVRLANRLDRDQFAPELVCLFGAGPLKTQLDPTVPVTVPRYVALQRPKPGRWRLAMLGLGNLRRHITTFRPDIIHAYMPAAYVLAAMASGFYRDGHLIASRRGLVSYRRGGSGMNVIAGQIANRFIDFHLFNSQAARDFAIAKERLPEENTAVIHNGIDVPPLNSNLATNATHPSAAMVANFIPYKRHADVIQATKLVVAKHANFSLTLVGDGPERELITHQVADLGLSKNVFIVGTKPNAADMLGTFDFTLLASSEESFPNALMESMAAAVPVIATRVGGVPELVRDGVDGILVEPGRPEQIARAMCSLIEDATTCRRMGQAARERVRREFSTVQMKSKTEDLYRRLLGLSSATQLLSH